jgi:hypothetical protein
MRKIAAGALALSLWCAPALAQQAVIGYESGPVAVTGTPANSSHAAGNVVGPTVVGTAGALVGPGGRPVGQLANNQSGIFVVPIARVNSAPSGGLQGGQSAIVTQFAMTSSGGSTGQYVVRIWTQPPVNTTCVDNAAFVGNFATDDNYLMTPPFSITPAAPASTTGDSSTYASQTVQTYDFESPQGLAYVCLQTVSTDTADDNKAIRIMMSGPQN